MQVNNPGPAPTYSNEGTPVSVYNALPPAAFTDLDLSGTIGAKPALVLLRIQQNTGGLAQIHLRRNGDTNTPIFGVETNSTNCANGSFLYLITDTDDAGIIEWKSSVAAGTVQIWIMSWLSE